MTTQFANNKVDICIFGQQLDLQRLSESVSKTYFVKKYREALGISTPKGQVFVFSYGVSVAWGISENKKTQLDGMLKPHISQAYEKTHEQEFDFEIKDQADFSILDGLIVLPDAKTTTLLAVSHGLAQSTKLAKFEQQAQRCIKDHAYLPLTLAKTGTVPLNRKRLAKLRGSLFNINSDIALHYKILHTPEFFYGSSQQQQTYLVISGLLDLAPRINNLSLKLETIHDLQALLTTEQNHQQWGYFKWLFTLLIALEMMRFFID
ncbi:RMD1 family protein [Paraglaciecola aestuariivivens]